MVAAMVNPTSHYSPWADEPNSSDEEALVEEPEARASSLGTRIPGSSLRVQFTLDETVELAALNEVVAAASGRMSKPVFLEMRHVAGLSCGTVLKLPEGHFEFLDRDDKTLFSLAIEDAIATVSGGAGELWCDETPVKRPTSLSRSVLNTGWARFIIRPPRSGYGEYSQPLEAKPKEAIEVPSFKRTSKALWQYGQANMGPTINLDTTSWEFIEAVRAARDEDARVQRQLHPDPEELSYRAYNDGFGLLQRDPDHPFFGRFSIAHGAIPWRPKFNKPDAIPKKLHANIDQLCSLASVPITGNLKKGPVAIVGSRHARLAAARHAIVSLTALSKPGSAEIKVITTDKNQNENWMWLSALPGWASASGNDERILVADGMRSFDLAGLEHAHAENGDMNLIILEESVKEVPAYCSVILQINDEGLCKATNRSGESINGTALGISEGFAAALATKLGQLHT